LDRMLSNVRIGSGKGEKRIFHTIRPKISLDGEGVQKGKSPEPPADVYGIRN